jgi:hypothetical protein
MKRLTWSASILCFAIFSVMPWSSPAEEMGAEDESEVATHMHEHLDRITDIKTSIIMGQLDGVRAPATWLAEHESVPGLPANFVPYVEMMREYARQVVMAADLDSAAVAVSSMARTCGNCHLVHEVDLKFGYDRLPNNDKDTVSHMQRHQWGADRLWEGLIGPADFSWNLGTDMLVDVPLHSADVVDGKTNSEDAAVIDDIAHRLHVLAGQGISARTPDSRSGLYGEILSLCAGCHTRVGGGPNK